MESSELSYSEYSHMSYVPTGIAALKPKTTIATDTEEGRKLAAIEKRLYKGAFQEASIQDLFEIILQNYEYRNLIPFQNEGKQNIGKFLIGKYLQPASFCFALYFNSFNFKTKSAQDFFSHVFEAELSPFDIIRYYRFITQSVIKPSPNRPRIKCNLETEKVEEEKSELNNIQPGEYIKIEPSDSIDICFVYDEINMNEETKVFEPIIEPIEEVIKDKKGMITKTFLKTITIEKEIKADQAIQIFTKIITRKNKNDPNEIYTNTYVQKSKLDGSETKFYSVYSVPIY